MSEEVSSSETAESVLALLQERPTASIRLIAAELGIGNTTAHRAITRLVRDGAVRIVRLGTSRGYATRFEVVR